MTAEEFNGLGVGDVIERDGEVAVVMVRRGENVTAVRAHVLNEDQAKEWAVRMKAMHAKL
jgi:hypothetical protein